MNEELYEILTFKNSEVSEREIVFKGNLIPLYPYLEIDKKANFAIIFHVYKDINIVATNFTEIKRASIKDAQYCLINLSNEDIQKILVLITAMDMDIMDILYELYIKDQPLEWRFY